MIQRILATLLLAGLYFVSVVHDTAQYRPPSVVAFHREERPAGRALVNHESARQEKSVPLVSSVALFQESRQAWMFSAKVIQLKEVSIYGKPGTIAQIAYDERGETRYAWAVIQIEDYRFVHGGRAIAKDQEILLETAGPHVSAEGVRWDACPADSLYCKYAGFVEGGFPVSEDYHGLTSCPSNRMIYSGHAAADWINGMLAWKIRVVRGSWVNSRMRSGTPAQQIWRKRQEHHIDTVEGSRILFDRDDFFSAP